MKQTVKTAGSDDYLAKIIAILLWIALVISITAQKIGENPHHFLRRKSSKSNSAFLKPEHRTPLQKNHPLFFAISGAA